MIKKEIFNPLPLILKDYMLKEAFLSYKNKKKKRGKMRSFFSCLFIVILRLPILWSARVSKQYDV